MFTINKNDKKQVDNLIRYIASCKFKDVNCEICKQPMLKNGILFDGAIRFNNPPQSATWSHRYCYDRKN